MRRLASAFFTCSILLSTSLAAAAPDYDFTVRLLNIGTMSPQPPRLVSVFNQDAADLGGRGEITLHFSVRKVSSGNQPDGGDPLFEGEATIRAGEASIVTGNPNTGRITLTYDPALDRLESQLVVRLRGEPFFGAYEVRVSDGARSTKALIFGALG